MNANRLRQEISEFLRFRIPDNDVPFEINTVVEEQSGS
jgi:hypothetical protein